MVELIKAFISVLCRPEVFFLLCALTTIASVRWAHLWVPPKIAFSIMGLAVALYVFSIFDSDFQQIAFKGDNIPIIGMLFMVVYFTWLAFYRGVQNDQRKAEGRPLIEDEDKEVKVLVWPHLLYIEFIVGVFVTAVLIVWSITIMAPLEEPASAARTPNPSKAPWYFLGLQEMLVYFDPWMAGVVAPSLIIVGLMALPYLDKNPKGNGYYTVKERPLAIGGFCFGFFVLWISLIFLGTALRGPNWNFFGPYDFWDVHKQPVLNNVNLSEIIFVKLLNQGLPAKWGLREAPGILAVLFYVGVAPWLLTKLRFMKSLYDNMGRARFFTFAFLLLMMLSLPIKMVLRWTLNLKYIVAIPEYFFNI